MKATRVALSDGSNLLVLRDLEELHAVWCGARKSMTMMILYDENTHISYRVAAEHVVKMWEINVRDPDAPMPMCVQSYD